MCIDTIVLFLLDKEVNRGPYCMGPELKQLVEKEAVSKSSILTI